MKNNEPILSLYPNKGIQVFTSIDELKNLCIYSAEVTFFDIKKKVDTLKFSSIICYSEEEAISKLFEGLREKESLKALNTIYAER